MKISYAITVNDEIEEIQRLLSFLLLNKREEDEIVVQQDIPNPHEVGALPTPKRRVFYYLHDLVKEDLIKYVEGNLGNDFSNFKNNLNSKCSGDYIFQLDADELPTKHLVEILPDLLKGNPSIDLFYLPRINTVEGITIEHVKKWRWNISKIDTQKSKKDFDMNNPQDVKELELIRSFNLNGENTSLEPMRIKTEYFKPIINYPDYQSRIYRNSKRIHWERPVHELIIGYKTFSHLPQKEEFCLYHPKGIKKQESQNEFYENM